ncbi:MAG: cysteine synthase family protein [Calditrichaeota bacterium]|nr:cysteine synthase family protein [Calditrichota bacterium]MCB9369654.1 cysteine synthase family protein [Calditrichota bacterium]
MASLPRAARTSHRVPPLVNMIGNTPLIELTSVTDDLSPDVRVFAKAEWKNPGGSVKDRAAWSMLSAALREGLITERTRVLEATSGNTGIALAMLGAALGIGVTLCIPENASRERKQILQAYGAELIFTDPLLSTDGAQVVAKQLKEKYPDNYCYLNQYANPANVQAHIFTTGPEIWRQTDGRVTHFVSGLGTTGTFTGISRYLKARAPKITVASFQPDSPFHGLEGLKHLPSVHVPEIFDGSLSDVELEVSTEDAYTMCKRLATEEGLLVGTSSGASAAAAFQLARTLDTGVVVTIFPDGAEKYLSTPVWEIN